MRHRLPPSKEETKHLLARAHEQGVAEYIYNFGPVPHEGCAEIYRECDAVILPSSLESFSNTIAEAWAMQKPLVISDLDWARSCCGEGAVYIRYRDSDDIARKLIMLKESPEYAKAIIEAGRRMQSTYPTSRERFAQYLELIETHARGAGAQ